MIFFTFTESDAGIAAGVVIVLALLVYRIFRREPFDRVVRFGIFIERQRYERPGGPASEQKTETWQWPAKKEEP